MEHHSPFVSLAIITLLAVSIPVLLQRLRPVLRLPIVVGEILAGIAIGQSGLDLVQPTAILDFLQEFGFVLLMFLSGLEINFNALNGGSQSAGRSWLRRPLPVALLYFMVTVLLALLVGLVVTSAGLARNALLMGLILSTTSLGIVVPVLKERQLTRRDYGQLVLVAALISDFATLLLLSLAIGILSSGLSLDLLLSLALLAAFVAAAKLGQRAAGSSLVTSILRELSHATAQIHVRGALALMVLWVVLAESLGAEVILGAFLAGAIISLSSRSQEHTLHEALDAFGYGFFIPIFFIMVGAKFDLQALVGSPAALLLVPLLIVAAYAVKLLPALLFRLLVSWRETLAAGALLSSRLSLIIAASAIALEKDLITTATNSAIILVAVVTCTLSPLLFNRILPPQPAEKREGVVICGTDQLAELLGGRLAQDGEQVLFIGRHAEHLERLAASGYRVVPGDPTDEQVLEQAGLARAHGLVVLTNAPELVLRLCRTARERFAVPVIVARVDAPEVLRELQALQVQVVQPALATALALEGALHFPAAYNMLLNKNDDVEFIDLTLRNRALVGRRLRDLRMPGNALVLGIRRGDGGEVVVPHGDTMLQGADVLMLVGRHDALREARGWLESPA